MSSITVFTYGDPSEPVRTAIGHRLASHFSPDDIIGTAHGTGVWGDTVEHNGTLIVVGASEEAAVRIAADTARAFSQDAIGVVHNATGATLATPHRSDLRTADEVWS